MPKTSCATIPFGMSLGSMPFDAKKAFNSSMHLAEIKKKCYLEAIRQKVSMTIPGQCH